VNCCVENFNKIFGRPLASLDEVRDILKGRNEDFIR
jgi:hypothetical protein